MWHCTVAISNPLHDNRNISESSLLLKSKRWKTSPWSSRKLSPGILSSGWKSLSAQPWQLLNSRLFFLHSHLLYKHIFSFLKYPLPSHNAESCFPASQRTHQMKLSTRTTMQTLTASYGTRRFTGLYLCQLASQTDLKRARGTWEIRQEL